MIVRNLIIFGLYFEYSNTLKDITFNKDLLDENSWKTTEILDSNGQHDYDEGLQIEAEGFLVENQNTNEDAIETLEMENNGMMVATTTKSPLEKKRPKSLPTFLRRDIDRNKIQSNFKNIENYAKNHFVYDKNIITVPTLPDKYYKQVTKSETNPDNQKSVKLLNHQEINTKKFNLFKKKPNITETNQRSKTLKSIKLKKGKLKKSRLNDKMTKNRPIIPGSFEHHRFTRAVTAKKERIWDFGVIPYDIDKIFSGNHKALFKQAMRHWENFTCIKFVERDPAIHPNYIYFTVRNCGCCSFVGKRGNGRQAISIGRNCEKFGIVVHELGHVIGFWHEHTRIDRDEHITINRGNILKGQEYNFNVLTSDEVNSLGLPYDYQSIMHYARNTFSKSVYLDTIAPVLTEGQSRPEIGQRLHLSSGDIDQANLLYKCPICGRTFQENQGEILSPIFGNNVSIDGSVIDIERCEWRITATLGERIILRVHKLNLFKTIGTDCENGYLEIRDGYWHQSPLIKKLCGNITEDKDLNNTSMEIITDSSRMLLTYVNRNLMKGFRGFEASFQVICGGEIFVNEPRRIDSPNYPLEYLPDKECTWKISVPEGYQVALKFQSFEVENHDNCIYDYVEIRDGNTNDSELIGVFCGYKIPPNIKSNSNQMLLKFVSDSSVQKVGFSAIIIKEFDECETEHHGCDHECINTLGGFECSCKAGYELQIDGKSCEDACGGIINVTQNGTTLSSPSFPDVYPILKDCVWEIVAPAQYNLFLNFTYFDLEGTKYEYTECNYDYITLYSKFRDNNRLRKIGKYCGNEKPPFLNSEQNILRFEFHSDKSVQHIGFLTEILIDIDECTRNNGGCQHYCKNTFGSYNCSCRNGYTLNPNQHNCTETKCKFDITSPYGVIHSPNYPQNYPRNTYCFWHFSTIPGQRIQLTFHDFEVESHQECIYDYVAIYDGKTENSSTLGVYCGGKEPYTVFGSTNELYMVLKTDIGLQKKGFMATHSTECGGYLRATNQTKNFYSHPRFGYRPYKKNMYCVWRIQADPDSSVKLSFINFALEYSEKCDYDFVEINEEYTIDQKSRHGKFCGHNKPPIIISYSDTLIMKFESDSSTSGRGFAVSYVNVEPPPEYEEESKDDDDSVTPFPGYHKSVYYDYDDDMQEQIQPAPLN